jgi:hypothetical protein
VVPDFSLSAEIRAIQQLMRTYRNIPMSLADACLVRMAELHEPSVIPLQLRNPGLRKSTAE